MASWTPRIITFCRCCRPGVRFVRRPPGPGGSEYTNMSARSSQPASGHRSTAGVAGSCCSDRRKTGMKCSNASRSRSGGPSSGPVLGTLAGRRVSLTGASLDFASFEALCICRELQARPGQRPAALPAFQELARKMAARTTLLRMPTFHPSSDDHYSSFRQLRRSIDAQRQAGKKRADMFVYSETTRTRGGRSQTGHPVYSNDQNVMIRGPRRHRHLGGGHPFSARGSTGPTTGI